MMRASLPGYRLPVRWGLSLLVVSTFGSASLAQTTYYVAANGNDGNDGRSTATPFQSLTKVSALALLPGDQLLLRRGDTFRGTLRIRRSGSAAQPIVFDAYGTGAKPVLSASLPLTNWTPLGNNRWQTTCSGCTGRVTGLYRRDAALPLGRYPNAADANRGYLTIQSHQGTTQITSRQAVPLSLNTGWAGTEIVIRATQWITNRFGFNGQSGPVLSLVPPPSGYGIQDGWGYFVQNHPATLDQPGEWAFDPTTKSIQLYDATGNPNDQTLTATALEQAVELANAAYVTLRNLRVTQAIRANVAVESGSNLVFSNLDITNAGGDGITIGGSGHTILIENSRIGPANNNGVTVGAYPNVTVRGNTLRHVGVDAGRSQNNDGQGNGLASLAEQTMLIEDNVIDSIGYNGISFTGGTTIRHNLISNFCLTKSDGGGLYTWNGNQANRADSHLLANVIFNGRGAPEGTPGGSYSGANGIYFDDCTQRAEATGNTIFACAGVGIFLHGTSMLTIVGNTSYNNGEAQLVLRDNRGLCVARGHSIQNNVLVSRLPTQGVVQYESNANDLSQYGTFDNNYYLRPFNDVFKIRAVYNDGGVIGADLSLGDWQRRFVNDLHSHDSPLTFNDYQITATGKSLLTNTFVSYNDGWGTWSPYGNGRADWDNTNRLDGGSLRIAFPAASNQPNSYALVNNGVGSVTAGKTYYLRFDAVASSAGKRVEVFLRQRGGSYQDLAPRKVMMVGQKRQSYEMAFTALADEGSAILVYQVGEDGQTAWFDNIRLEEAVRTTVNPDDCLKLLHNPTLRDSVVLLNGGYRDAGNQPYSGSVRLAPFASLLLLRDPLVAGQPAPADLSLTLSVDRPVLPIGQPTTFRLRVRHERTVPAGGPVRAQWVCRLPGNVQFSGGSGFQYANGVLSGVVQALSAGADTTVVFQLKPTQPGTYRIAAQLTTATRPDPDSSPDSGTADGEDDASTACFRTYDAGNALFESPNPAQRPLPVVLSSQAPPNPDRTDLSLRMAVSNRSPAPNQVVTYTIWVTNTGGHVTGAVQLQNQLPPGLDFVGGAGWLADGTRLSTSLSNLPAGGVVATSFQARVTGLGQLVNQVQIGRSDWVDADSIPGNGFGNGEDDQAQADVRVK